MKACVHRLSSLLLVAAVATATESAGSSLAGTTPFRFPTNLEEAFRVDGTPGLGGRGFSKANDNDSSGYASGSGSTSGSTSGATSGSGSVTGSEPASGRQYGDGHSQSYGTSWNNHYQSPTKGSSYDSRYDAPEKGDSDRYNDEGHHQYNHKGGDSDSVSYHSETPYGGGHYSGGTYHSGGGNYHGDGRNNYRGGDDHYGGGGGRYDGGGNNYDDGYNYGGGDGYGGSRNHDGGRNHNDDITSYTTGDSHYNGGGDGRNDYDGNDHGYGGSRNHYEGDENHYGGGGNNYGYGGDSHGDDYGRGHGGYSGHDEYGHGSHDEYGHGSHGGYDHGGHGGGYGGPGRGSNGHSEDPIDEYAVYSPKMSGTYRRRSDPGQGGHHRGGLRRPVSEGNTFGYGVAKPPGVDRKDDFEDFSSRGKAQSLLDMINQRTEEAFSGPESPSKYAEKGYGGKGGFNNFKDYGFDTGNNQKHFKINPKPMKYQKKYEGLGGPAEHNFDGHGKVEPSKREPLKRPSGFDEFIQEPPAFKGQFKYIQQKSGENQGKTFGDFHIPDHIFNGDSFFDQRNEKITKGNDHQGYKKQQSNDGAFFIRGQEQHQVTQNDIRSPGSQYDIRVNEMFDKISNPFQSHGPQGPGHESDVHKFSEHDDASDTMPHKSRYQEVAAMAREAVDPPTVEQEADNIRLNETDKELVHNRTKRNISVSEDANALPQSVAEINSRSESGINSREDKKSEPREVHPVIHRYFDGVPHMIHRDMGDEVFEDVEGKSELAELSRDARRFRLGFRNPFSSRSRPLVRRPQRGTQRNHPGRVSLHPPRGFPQSSPQGHHQRQHSRGAVRPAFSLPGQLPPQRETSSVNGNQIPQQHHGSPQHQEQPSQLNSFHSSIHQGQFRSPQISAPESTTLQQEAAASTTQKTPTFDSTVPFPVQQGTAVSFKKPFSGNHQSYTVNHFANGQHSEYPESTTYASSISAQGKDPDQRLSDNFVDVDGVYGALNFVTQSKPGSASDLALFDPITQASTIGEVRRNDIQVSPGFKPGALEHGFLPILPPKHHISRRSLQDKAAKVSASSKHEVSSSLSAKSTEQLGSKTETSLSSTAQADLTTLLQVKNSNTNSSSSLLNSTDSSSSPTDLALASSRRQSDYQPYYSNYKGRHGYRNYKTQQDPYQRYLPREDENDPYFRYASRENIQHSHEGDVPPEVADERLKGHQEHDLYGTRGTRRPTTARRNKPRHAPNVKDDYDYYYDDSDLERPRYDGEQRRTAGYGPGYDSDYGARRKHDDRDYRDDPPRSQGRQDDYHYDYEDYPADDYDYGDHGDYRDANNRYHDDEDSGYHGDGVRRGTGGSRNKSKFYDPGYQSGRYKDDPTRDYYGASGDERIRDIDGEIRDEAHRGYADSRRTVSAMLDTLAQKKGDANCKEVAKDGMTCYQCTDAKGFQTEDCAYASNSKDPNNQHVSYSESSSYGDPKQDKHSSTPGDKHKRDGGDTYNFDYEPDFDGIEIDSERDDYHSGPQGGRNSQDPDEHFSGEDDFLTPDEEQDKARYQTPGAFKSGRFRDTYAGRVRSRSKRHAGHYHGPEDNSNTTEHQPVADDSYTGRALARFLSDDEHNHEVGPRTDTQGELQYHEDTPQYRSEEPQYRAGVAQYGEDTPKYLQEVPKYSKEVPQYHSDARPAQRRSGGGYHVRGVVPEYHRKVESSQSSGGGYDRYGTGQRRPAPPPPSQDYTEEHDAGYRDGDHSATIGDLFDYRFGKAPIDDKFVERLQEDRQDDEPAEYEYDDSERPEYEDPNVPDYDYDYQGSGQDYEYVDYPSQRRPSRAPEDTPNRYSDYRDGPPQYYSRNPSGHTYPAVDSYPAQRQQRRGAENSRSTDSQEPEPSQRSYGADGAATYNKDRYQRHQADDRDNSVKERERAQDMAPLNDEPAPYETHTYTNPDATRSYEVSAHSRPSLTDDLGMPRGYLHSDTRPTNGRSAPGYGDGLETRYDRPETYASLNRGSAMTRQYQDPGREFFRSHPVGFEHFPNFDYVEKEKKNK